MIEVKKNIAGILILLLSISLFITPSYTIADQAQGRLIILFEDREELSRAEEALLEAGIFAQSFDKLNGMVVHANEKAIENMPFYSEISSIEHDQIVSMLPKKENPAKPGGDTTVTNPQVQDWGIGAINAPSVWNSYSGSSVKVAVIDTGIDSNHPDLKVYGGANFVARAKSYDDDNGHGSHVAGTIAALNNSQGVVGVAYNSELYAVKVLDRRGSGYLSDVILGIEWAIDNQMDVINMSLGSNSPSSAFESVLNYAAAENIIVVAAAGNDASAVDYPGAYPTTIAVGAIDDSLDLAYFSSNGPEVDVVAPGVNIYSTYKEGSYKSLNGTSMASPHVAGIAAIYKEKYPNSNINDFRDYLVNSSIDLGETGFDYYYGHGLPNLINIID